MDDGRADGAPVLRDRIDRLRRADAPDGAAPGPDAVSALTACIRTEDRAAARSLALAWLRAAELALTADPAAAREHAALALLARVTGVPAAYFTDDETSRVEDGARELAAGVARRGVTSHGPCRTGVPGPGVPTVRDRLVRELERDRPPG